MKTLSTLVAVFFSCALISVAAEGSRDRSEQLFKNFDTDGDGVITLVEYRVGMGGNMSPVRVEAVFKEKDLNGDGKLTLTELLYVPQDQRPSSPAPTKADPKKSDKKKK